MRHDLGELKLKSQEVGDILKTREKSSKVYANQEGTTKNGDMRMYTV
jgi:hypothetical protein